MSGPTASTSVPAASPAEPGASDLVVARACLDEAVRGFRALQAQAEGALAQCDDADLWVTLDAEANSIGVLVRHVAGNLRSRFTSFPIEDGEKPWRDREGEFAVRPELARAALEAEWRAGWQALYDALAALAPEALLAPATIRGERSTVLQAIGRATRHVAGHVGQIVLLARHRRGAAWRTLSIPRGGSAEFDARMRADAERDPSTDAR